MKAATRQAGSVALVQGGTDGGERRMPNRKAVALRAQTQGRKGASFLPACVKAPPKAWLAGAREQAASP
jgi:hypothetical protein